MKFLYFYFERFSKFKFILTWSLLGFIVQVGYDVALTRRRSRVQIPVDPFFSGYICGTLKVAKCDIALLYNYTGVEKS